MGDERTATIRAALTAVLGSVLLAGCGGTAPSATTTTVTVTAPAPPPTVMTVTVSAEAPEPASSTAPAAGPQTSFDNGTFLVGTDIAPGTYRTPGPADPGMPLCAYVRMKDTSGDLAASSLGGGSTQGPAVVTIKKTDAAFQSVGCATWTRVS